METQFDNLKINTIYSNEEYYCSPTIKTTGFTLVMRDSLMGNYDHLKDIVDICNSLQYDVPRILNEENKLGWTSLMVAARNVGVTSNVETIKLLLDNNADVDKQNIKGQSALLLAAQFADNTNTSSIATVKLLLDHGAIVNDENMCGCTALSFACANNNVELAKLLLDYGADVNISNICRICPLYFVLMNPVEVNIELLLLLLENGADIHNINMFDTSPLLYAINNCTDDIIAMVFYRSDRPHESHIIPNLKCIVKMVSTGKTDVEVAEFLKSVVK